MKDGDREVIAAGADERRNLSWRPQSSWHPGPKCREGLPGVLDAGRAVHGLGQDVPRLLFKGGASLSRAFGLIPRFSEDIDITVRSDVGQRYRSQGSRR